MNTLPPETSTIISLLKDVNKKSPLSHETLNTLNITGIPDLECNPLLAIYRSQGRRVLWHLMSHNLIGFDLWEDIQSEKLEIYHVEV